MARRSQRPLGAPLARRLFVDPADDRIPMHPEHTLNAPEAHSLVQRIKNLRPGALAVRHRPGVRMETTAAYSA